jgi:hypothetical protein
MWCVVVPVLTALQRACPYRFGRALRCPTSVWLANGGCPLVRNLRCAWMTCARAHAPRLAWLGNLCGRCAGLHRAESALTHAYVQQQVVVQVPTALVQVCAAGTTADAGTSVAAGASGSADVGTIRVSCCCRSSCYWKCSSKRCAK